ncbi:MAG TPA: ABC transporter permease [Armatimonadota bacterium]
MRALGVHRGRTTLTALGVIIGVGAVIAMVGLGTGFGNAITREINAGGANWVWLIPGQQNNGPGPRRTGRLSLADLDALKTHYPDTVSMYVPVSMGQATIKYRNKNSTTTYAGSVPAFQQEEDVSLAHGSFYHKRDVDGAVKTAVLGSKVVKDLTGDENADLTGRTVFINRQAFTVCGILKAKGQFMGGDQDNRVMIPLSTAMRRLQTTDYVSYAAVKASSAENVQRVVDQIKRTLRVRHTIKPPYKDNDDFFTQTQEGAMREVGQVTGILSMLLGSIAAISLFVGGIGIMNIMLVSVTERTQEIGLRKAIGATMGTILSQFLIESVMVSVLGGLLGVAFGYGGLLLAAWAINNNTPVKIDPGINFSSVALAFTVSATIGVVFGMYPAWRAARMDPITALRYE